ncbi:hypothetical protein PFMALIP_04178 [Plasmodium falciparum MaliPS096_E11]|uniref:Uncharacterized protein n=1 Tax=Plasmodium falciparum MaliPS096_E11 TaxID=1036727 RepID=A0A024WKL9_PLAFA|nr:hypothetical protein PFMALIP_04178 [Plasmodium falciparum MaliPS096_E11]
MYTYSSYNYCIMLKYIQGDIYLFNFLSVMNYNPNIFLSFLLFFNCLCNTINNLLLSTFNICIYFPYIIFLKLSKL